MIRLYLFILHLSIFALAAQDKLRKVSGDAAPEKAQESIFEIDDFIPTIDSSVSMSDHIPEPPAFDISIKSVPLPTAQPQPPASLSITSSPSSQPAPPSLRPPESSSTLTPSTTVTTLSSSPSSSHDDDNNPVTMTLPYEENTVDINDILPEPVDDLEEFQKADVLEKEKEEEVKDLVRKTTVNTTDDYYITSSPTTMTSESQSDTVEEKDGNDVFDFDKLFDKKISDEKITSGESDDGTENSTIATTNSTSTTTMTLPTTSELMTSTALLKTCIEVNKLKAVDESVKGTKKGTIEVSVELGDEDFTEEEDDDASEEEETLVRRARDKQKEEGTKKKTVVWKKFEMNCDEEEDEKGQICKLWALGGLCGTHKPTMFLFCRKTCLCVGPS